MPKLASPAETRVCTKCGRDRPVDEYPWNNGRRRSYCKKCRTRQTAEYKRQRRQRDPAYREQLNAERRAWGDRNRKRIKAYNRKYQQRLKKARTQALWVDPALFVAWVEEWMVLTGVGPYALGRRVDLLTGKSPGASERGLNRWRSGESARADYYVLDAWAVAMAMPDQLHVLYPTP